MIRTVLILIAFAVAICMPWLIVRSDISGSIHPLPGGWDWVMFHSIVVIHTPSHRPLQVSLKDIFVVIAILVLITLIFIAAVHQRRHQVQGFEVQREAPGEAAAALALCQRRGVRSTHNAVDDGTRSDPTFTEDVR
jgi:hypothetical protein